MSLEINNEKIKEVISRLVKVYHPDQVYLFGSYAWGVPDLSSDLDVCIIVHDADENQAERIRIGLRALKGIHIPVDILVYTWKEIEKNRNHPSTLIYKIFNKGRKLYEAA